MNNKENTVTPRGRRTPPEASPSLGKKPRARSHGLRVYRAGTGLTTHVGPRRFSDFGPGDAFRAGRKPGRLTAPHRVRGWYAVPPSPRVAAEIRALQGLEPARTPADAPPADPWGG